VNERQDWISKHAGTVRRSRMDIENTEGVRYKERFCGSSPGPTSDGVIITMSDKNSSRLVFAYGSVLPQLSPSEEAHPV